MTMPGILVRLWRWLFYRPRRPGHLERCSAERFPASLERCKAIEDPRCKGLNCTRHCLDLCQCFPRGPAAAPEAPAAAPAPAAPASPHRCHDKRCEAEGRHRCHDLTCKLREASP